MLLIANCTWRQAALGEDQFLHQELKTKALPQDLHRGENDKHVLSPLALNIVYLWSVWIVDIVHTFDTFIEI